MRCLVALLCATPCKGTPSCSCFVMGQSGASAIEVAEEESIDRE